MTQWRQVQSLHDTPSHNARSRGRVERQRFPKPLEAGSTPAGDTSPASFAVFLRYSRLVMRLASQSHCLWDETGSIPVRGATANMGCRVMVTGRASKTRREGSIPSRPAEPQEIFDDDDVLFLLGSRTSRDGLCLRTSHHRVPRMHRPLLDVAPPARQPTTSTPQGSSDSVDFILRGRHSLARLRPCDFVPAVWGDSSTGEFCFRSARIGVRFPVAPPDSRQTRLGLKL